jgi:hypothetical protein
MNPNSTTNWAKLDVRMKNKDYVKFREQKQELLEKYPDNLFADIKSGRFIEPYPEEDRETYKRWLKEICDLLHEQDGNYQKFVWSTLSTRDKFIREHMINGRKKYDAS